MDYKKQTMNLLAFIFAANFFAQKLDFQWSEKMIYNKKTDGFFDYFVSTTSKYVIAKFSTDYGSSEKIKLIAFDKTNMSRVNDVVVCDRKNASDKLKYKDMSYFKTIAFENNIYVFWVKTDKEKKELFAQSFDGKLNPSQVLKKVYEVSIGRKNDKKGELIVMANIELTETILIGAELAGNKGESITFEYKILSANFSFAGAGQIKMPINITGRSYGLSSNYQYGADGNVHARTYIRMDRDEIKLLKKNESAFYSLYTVIDVNNNTSKTYTFKFENKNIFNFGFKIDKTGSKIYGFFCDITKDPRGNDTHGIFYCTINGKTKELGKINFAYFTKQQLDKLYSQDREDRKNVGLFSSKKKKASQSESLGNLYEIEQVISVDADNLVLFCSVMGNYSVRTCDSKGNCTTSYYCVKSNVTVFKINASGDIVWASNLDRRSPRYSGWDIYDLKVVSNKNNTKFLVTYGSSFDADATNKNFNSAKSGTEMRDKFEYAVFDYETGIFKKEDYIVNTKATLKQDRKFVNVLNMQVIDNKFFIDSNPNVKFNGQSSSGCFSPGKGTSAGAPGYLGVVNLLN